MVKQKKNICNLWSGLMCTILNFSLCTAQQCTEWKKKEENSFGKMVEHEKCMKQTYFCHSWKFVWIFIRSCLSIGGYFAHECEWENKISKILPTMIYSINFNTYNNTFREIKAEHGQQDNQLIAIASVPHYQNMLWNEVDSLINQ